MSGWHTGRMLLVDTETTGTDPHRDRIVTAAAIRVGDGQPTETRTWLINPGIPISPGATEVHGVSNEHAQTNGGNAAPSVLDIGETVMAAISDGLPVVGHNVGPYDLTLLCSELTRHGHTNLATRISRSVTVVDTMVIEKHLDQYRPAEHKPSGRRPAEACGSHKLVDCCRLWGVELSEADAHGAEADALAAGRLAWRLATDPLRFAQYDYGKTDRIDPGRMSLAELHSWQVGQYARSSASYQAYVRGEQKGKPDEVDSKFVTNTSWPIQGPPEGWSPDQLPVVVEAVSV